MKEFPSYPAWILSLAGVFERVGAPLYLVGGAVRNPLMGLPISDVDACGPALPQEVLAFCQGRGIRAYLRAAHFGTVELHAVDEEGTRHMAEYTTFREDSYRCGHRPEEVRFTKDIAVDALRRDFSVNALYRPVTQEGPGEVIDPTGGLAHLAQGILHTVTSDPDQVLGDDGLRILRAARFQAELGLAPTESLLHSAARHVTLLEDIAPERLRDELEKILLADFRYPVLSRSAPAALSGLHTVCRVGAWPYLFPSLAYGEGEAQALSALKTPGGVSLMGARLALLFWQAQAEPMQGDLRRLRFSEKVIAEAMALGQAMKRLADKGGPSLFEAVEMGLPAVQFAHQAFGALAKQGDSREQDAAMAHAKAAEGLAKRLQSGIPLSLKKLAVNGDDLKPLLTQEGLPLSQMSLLLRALWQAAAEGDIPNQRDALLGAARVWIASGLGGEI